MCRLVMRVVFLARMRRQSGVVCDDCLGHDTISRTHNYEAHGGTSGRWVWVDNVAWQFTCRWATQVEIKCLGVCGLAIQQEV
jgi:hypothetical protein